MNLFHKLKNQKVDIPQELLNEIHEYISKTEESTNYSGRPSICYSLSEVVSSTDEEEFEEISDEIDSTIPEFTFSDMLFKLIDSKGLKDSLVYKKAFIDRRLFSKIRSNKDYHPRKGTIIQISLALELSIDETLKLLDLAGYSLPKNSKINIVILYILEHEIYDVQEANNILYTICNVSLDQI